MEIDDETRKTFGAGATLWTHVRAGYELNPAEVETLYQACQASDLIEQMLAELAVAPSLTVRGSTGQPSAHPLLAAVAMQQRTLTLLLDKLGLTDAEDAPPAALPPEVTRLLPKEARGGEA